MYAVLTHLLTKRVPPSTEAHPSSFYLESLDASADANLISNRAIGKYLSI